MELDAAPGANDVDGAHVWLNTSGSTLTENLRLSSLGKLTIGASAGTQTHTVNGGATFSQLVTVTSSAVTSGNGIVINASPALNADNELVDIAFHDNGTRRAGMGIKYESTATAGVVGYVALLPKSVTGETFLWFDNTATLGLLRASTSFSNVGNDAGTVVGDQTSDERLKSDIVDYEGGLASILNLRPIRYNMGGVNTIGFGAQTTQPVIPEAVYNTKDLVNVDAPELGSDRLAMKYHLIIPALVNAIKELTARIVVLEGQP
jgi:hypothetical protein